MSDQDELALTEFAKFLQRRYHEMGARYPGRYNSAVEFGKWLLGTEYKQSTFSTWWTGTKTPTTNKWIDAIAEKLGVETYDALGMARRMPKSPKLNLIATVWDKLPPEKQDEWYEFARNIAEDNGNEHRKRAQS